VYKNPNRIVQTDLQLVGFVYNYTYGVKVADKINCTNMSFSIRPP